MRDCSTPFFPTLTRDDALRGVVVYPEDDPQLSNTESVLCHPCHRCTNCRNMLRWRWVGRVLAQRETCLRIGIEPVFLTWTYGDDRYIHFQNGVLPHPHADHLVYSDVQKCLKRMRRDGLDFSAAVVGEYGERRGRAHFHAALFPNDHSFPEYREGMTKYDKYWEHGHVDAKVFNEERAAYLCAYLLPEPETVKQGLILPDDRKPIFRKSTRPPLATAFFEDRARQHVIQGLAPQDGTFSFPGIIIDKGARVGELKQFFPSTLASDRYLSSFERQWHELRPGEFMPESEYLQDFLDRRARQELAKHDDDDLAVMANLKTSGSYYADHAGIVIPRWFRAPGRGGVRL